VRCSLWGTNWILKYYLDELRLQRVKKVFPCSSYTGYDVSEGSVGTICALWILPKRNNARFCACLKIVWEQTRTCARAHADTHTHTHTHTHKSYVYLYIVFRQLDAIYIHVVFINEVSIHHVFKHHSTSVLCEQDTCTRHRSISERLFFCTRLELFCLCIIVNNAARFTNCGPRPDKTTSPQLHNRNTKYFVRLMDHQLCIQMNVSHSTQRNEAMKLNFM
jgi:hypothetical protein